MRQAWRMRRLLKPLLVGDLGRLVIGEMDLVNLWKCIDLGEPYDWKVSRPAEGQLAALLGKSHSEMSRPALVEQVGPMLRGDKAYDTALWIIRCWGGIYGNKEATIRGFLSNLGDFSSEEIARFICRRGVVGVSSWSKLLAFYSSEKFAIYDSRTALALNVAMLHLDSDLETFFPMPCSRNKVIGPARCKIKKITNYRARQIKPKVAYSAYLNVLERLKEHRGLSSVGDVEMVIFANAEAIVRKYA